MNYQSPRSVEDNVNRLTLQQRYNINLLLSQHCKSVDGYSVYEKDWDDERIAAATGVRPNSIGYMRRGVFGKFAPVKAVPRAKDVLEARISRIEAQIAKLIASLGGGI